MRRKVDSIKPGWRKGEGGYKETENVPPSKADICKM